MTTKNSCTCGHSDTIKNSSGKDSLWNKDNNKPILLALLPCGLRNPFQQAVLNAFPEYANPENTQVVIEGNLNYEKSLFTSIDTLTSLEEFPDIFISSDINSLYHTHFRNHFLNKDNFETFTQEVHPLFKEANYVHPEGLMGWFTTNLLVMVVDTEKLGVRQLPESWLDILKESYSKDLTLRGDTDFFCNAMFFPYKKDIGNDAIRRLGQNTAKGLHPSQMVKILNAGNTEGTTVYVLPYSFALKVRDKSRFKIVFPVEGAIVSPVQMLVKKGAYPKHKKLIDYILSLEMAEILIHSGFPSSHALAENKLPGNTLQWVGWDFLNGNDIRACKEEMQQVFFSEFKGSLNILESSK